MFEGVLLLIMGGGALGGIVVLFIFFNKFIQKILSKQILAVKEGKLAFANDIHENPHSDKVLKFLWSSGYKKAAEKRLRSCLLPL